MHPQQDFIVIDTEGKGELREIAIINSQGQLIYEAFAKEHLKNDERVLNLRPLREIVVDFQKIAKTLTKGAIAYGTSQADRTPYPFLN